MGGRAKIHIMEDNCHVCGQPVDDIYGVDCTVCGKKIHCPSEENAESYCGRPVTQLYACGLSFMCNPCSDRELEKYK